MVDYRLTDLGHLALKLLAWLIVWADKRHEGVQTAHDTFDKEESVAPRLPA